MGALTVIVLIAFPAGLAGALGALFDRVVGRGGNAATISVVPDPSALAAATERAAAGRA